MCCILLVIIHLIRAQSGLGKLVVMGSAHIFHDQYIDKEENNKLQEVIFRWLTSDDITLNTIDGEDPEVIDCQWISACTMDLINYSCMLLAGGIYHS